MAYLMVLIMIGYTFKDELIALGKWYFKRKLKKS